MIECYGVFCLFGFIVGWFFFLSICSHTFIICILKQDLDRLKEILGFGILYE